MFSTSASREDRLNLLREKIQFERYTRVVALPEDVINVIISFIPLEERYIPSYPTEIEIVNLTSTPGVAPFIDLTRPSNPSFLIIRYGNYTASFTRNHDIQVQKELDILSCLALHDGASCWGLVFFHRLLLREWFGVSSENRVDLPVVIRVPECVVYMNGEVCSFLELPVHDSKHVKFIR